MQKDTYAVIMAGGKGERFWPLSTAKRPKQVLTLFGDKPMLAMALDYLRGLIPPERVFVITSADLVDATCKAAPHIPRKNVIGEPFGRDTAAVCALASALVKAKNPDGIFCILTADHIIGNVKLFQATLRESIQIARKNDVLITIGIKPTYPSTGFGYIEAAETFGNKSKAVKFRKVKRFVEKPDIKTAERYLRLNKFFWNSGMFVWSVKSLQSALRKHAKQLHAMAERMLPAVGTGEFNRRLKKEYAKLDKISVDYALMEKADNIVMAQGTFGWDDVGSWAALQNHFKADSSRNVMIGACENIGAEGNIVVSRERLTALIGVKDLVVVQAENATLICAKERAQDVRKMVHQLAKSGKHGNVL
jgi:mannose-1-phosphate guanylyltransferase